MPVGLHLKPGQKGTKRLVADYGDRLVCVRYRYDAARKRRIKTVELIVAESDWHPRFAADQIVAVKIDVTDLPGRARVKQAAARGIQTKGSGTSATTAWSHSVCDAAS
jgi:hypothetical protein